VITVTCRFVLLGYAASRPKDPAAAAFQGAGESVEARRQGAGSRVKGRDPEGYYELVRGKVERPTDWRSLEKSFADKTTIMGTVTGRDQGRVERGCGRARVYAGSRTGVREAAIEMEKLVGQEIRCRITKLDATEEDVVVDRRVIAEEEERGETAALFGGQGG